MELHLEGKDEEAYTFLNHSLYNIFVIYTDKWSLLYTKSPDDGNYYSSSNGYNVTKWFDRKKEEKIKEFEPLYNKIGKEIPSYLKEIEIGSFIEFQK